MTIYSPHRYTQPDPRQENFVRTHPNEYGVFNTDPTPEWEAVQNGQMTKEELLSGIDPRPLPELPRDVETEYTTADATELMSLIEADEHHHSRVRTAATRLGSLVRSSHLFSLPWSHKNVSGSSDQSDEAQKFNQDRWLRGTRQYIMPVMAADIAKKAEIEAAEATKPQRRVS